MWWGGNKGDDEDASSSSPEVVEILSEEDVMQPASAPPGPPPPEDEELERLKGQFAQQEDLLGQLRGVLQRNEEKLHTKELEVKVCTVRSPFGKARSPWPGRSFDCFRSRDADAVELKEWPAKIPFPTA